MTGRRTRLWCSHASGLEAPEGAEAVVELLPDRVETSCAGKVFSLEKHRINEVRLDSEIIYGPPRPSLLGAVIGAEHGALGAAIGAGLFARSHAVDSDLFLIFDYDGGAGQLVFACDRSQPLLTGDAFAPRKFLKDFRKGKGYAADQAANAPE